LIRHTTPNPPPPNPHQMQRAHAGTQSATRSRLTKLNKIFVFISHVPPPAIRCHCASARFCNATEGLLFAPSFERALPRPQLPRTRATLAILPWREEVD